MSATAPARLSILSFSESSRSSIRAGLTVAVVDLLAILVAGLSAYLIRLAFGGQLEASFYLRLVPLIGIFIATYGAASLYPGILLNPVVEIQGIVKSTTISYLFLAAATFFQRDAEAYSRLGLLISWMLTIPAVLCGRYAVRRWGSKKSWWGSNAVVLGYGSSAARVVEALTSRPELGIKVVGVLNNSLDDSFVAGVPVLGGFSLAPTLADQYGIRYGILALPEMRSDELAFVVQRYASRFHNVLVIPDLFGISSLGVNAKDLGGVIGLEISHRLLYRAPQILKRTFDLFAASIGLAILAPILAILWVVIRATSSGPAFFCQERIGEDGNRFHAWKFRSMYTNGPEILEAHIKSNPHARNEWRDNQKLKNDPRITSIGRFLRTTSLDELPQLWNVVRGDMSLVGPRPIVAHEISKYGDGYELYRRVRPGLSGLWQVSGRNNTTYAERVALDQYYVRNWSIWLDFYIIGRTFKVVLTGEGAY